MARNGDRAGFGLERSRDLIQKGREPDYSDRKHRDRLAERMGSEIGRAARSRGVAKRRTLLGALGNEFVIRKLYLKEVLRRAWIIEGKTIRPETDQHPCPAVLLDMGAEEKLKIVEIEFNLSIAKIFFQIEGG